MLVKEKCGSKNPVCPKKLCVPKNCGSKKLCVKIKCGSQKQFDPEKM